jgi:hypothetical protein
LPIGDKVSDISTKGVYNENTVPYKTGVAPDWRDYARDTGNGLGNLHTAIPGRSK